MTDIRGSLGKEVPDASMQGASLDRLDVERTFARDAEDSTRLAVSFYILPCQHLWVSESCLFFFFCPAYSIDYSANK